MKEFSVEELAAFDGKDGRPVYVAHHGKVYDLSNSRFWKGGAHMRRHQAGHDLSTDLQAAPHGIEKLEQFPQVGIVKEPSDSAAALPPFLEGLFKRIPMLRRHPHPMTVHFPIVFMLFTPVFSLLYLATGQASFETTALHCLGAGLLFLPIVILTGLLTWWVNYLAKPMGPVSIKICASIALFLMALSAFTWRMAAPQVLTSPHGVNPGYLALVILLAPTVIVIGWFGAQLTFPFEKEERR
jgi:predicted heme/steroid binding protein/uncharacterized membrane protein